MPKHAAVIDFVHKQIAVMKVVLSEARRKRGDVHLKKRYFANFPYFKTRLTLKSNLVFRAFGYLLV